MNEEAPLDLALAEAPDGGRAFWLDAGGVRVRAAVWPGGQRGTALILNGRSEYIEKYGRVIVKLRARGFSVATLDWRGQGLSDRALHEPMKGHVADFSEYQLDVEALLAAPEVASLPSPRLLLCHSMGGCIGLRALVEGRIRPAATIMSAPMLGIEMSGLETAASRVLAFASDRLGLGALFSPSPRPRTPYVLKTDFADNTLTGDADHYELMRRQLRAKPEFGLGPPTLNWIARAMDECAALAGDPAPRGPMLFLLGDKESVVSSEAIRSFVARAPNCALLDVPGGRHETLMETEAALTLIWARIDRFLSAVKM